MASSTPLAATKAAGKQVMAVMASMGHGIDAKVTFDYDPELRIMGYSRPVSGGFRVVAGRGAMQGSQLLMLLTHELSHVQRMASGHPSHSQHAIQAAYDAIRLHGPQESYHDEILHDAINNVEDLYADGIAFEVIKRLDAAPANGIGEFFLGWMQGAPAPGANRREKRWRAAHSMLTNARALAQLRSESTPRQLAEAELVNRQLAAVIPADVAQSQAWFRRYFERLPADSTEETFVASLVEYVQRFVAVAESGDRRRPAS